MKASWLKNVRPIDTIWTKGCSDSPVIIFRTCGHVNCVNSKALELAGITKDTPDPQGGEIDRDENGGTDRCSTRKC